MWFTRRPSPLVAPDLPAATPSAGGGSDQREGRGRSPLIGTGPAGGGSDQREGRGRSPLIGTGPAGGEILLLNPFYPKDPVTSFGKHVLTPTLALTSLAGATPHGWNVRVWDENLLQGPAPSDPVPEVVGITVHLTFARRAYALAARYRAMGSKVVLGGLHVTACPEEASRHADAIVVGEGVHIWPRLLADVRAGALAQRYEGSYRVPFSWDPCPARSVLPRGAFLTNASIIATRGCSNRCGFCYLSTQGLRMPYQRRRVEQIADEIRASGERYVVFLDNNLTSDLAFARELCDALTPLRIVWSAAVTIDAATDTTLLSKMERSGCRGVFIGYETIEARNLESAGKRTMPPEAYAEHTKRFHDAGIQVNGSFVFGFDHDGPSVFEDTVRWVENNRLACATFHILTPYPGTPLFDRLEAEGRMLHREWSLYDTGHAVFRPKRMTPEQLEDGYRRAYRELFSHRSIWKRRPPHATEAALYLGMAYLYKRANPLWAALIRNNLTHAAWRPLVTLWWAKHQLHVARTLDSTSASDVTKSRSPARHAA